MKRNVVWKALAVLGLSLVLMIPLLMIEGQISARQGRQGAVEQDIAQSAAGPQQLTGPLLVVWYTEKVAHTYQDADTKKMVRNIEEKTQWQVLVPTSLEIAGEARIEERYRGIYKAQLYHLGANLKGRFHLPKDLGLDLKHRDITFGEAHLLLGISDVRGIESSPRMQWNGKAVSFKAGAHRDVIERGIQADLGVLALDKDQEIPFELPLNLMGSQYLSFAPVAEDTRVSLVSNWASPSFGGRFLPAQREVRKDGFKATWQVSHLARDLDEILEGKGSNTSPESFQVAFIDPTDIYLMSERAVKYGFLFIGLTFGAFFFFEVLKRLPIHPIQYGLVGCALGLFFLLLISLSEHVPFLAAYLLSGGAGVLLLGFYLSHVLKSRMRGLGFAASIAVLYAVLYGLLVSEDNALLMGSLMLFVILGAAMVVTRRLDWYRLTAPGEPPAES